MFKNLNGSLLQHYFVCREKKENLDLFLDLMETHITLVDWQAKRYFIVFILYYNHICVNS